MKYKNIIKYSVIVIFILLLSLFLIRLFSSRHLDDLHPSIPCDESLIKKSDYLAVIPKFNNQSISDNIEWCNKIKSFNKTIIMHGVYHTYNEFNIKRDTNYIQEGEDIIKSCFGENPKEFKAPQLAISSENKRILEDEFGFKVYTKFTQLLHKTYHCNDTGLLSNKLQDWI